MITPVIMAGGVGSRLWPLSRELYPKQFLNITDEMSMLQKTVSRLSELEHSNPIIVCNEEHRFITAEQLRTGGISHAGIILEPVGKNTAPAIALAALHAINSVTNSEEPLLLVLAADHTIKNELEFIQSIKKAQYAALNDKLVTFGIVAESPETAYGYIKAGDKDGETYSVCEFVEKPDLDTAIKYLAEDNYYWNSGMFLFKARRYLDELAKYEPEIFNICKEAISKPSQDAEFTRVDAEVFKSCPVKSVDYAIMEKTDSAVMLPMEAGWSDVGSFSSLWDVSDKDDNNNVIYGDVISLKSKDNYIHSSSKLIATIGIDNLIVVETKDAILVANKEHDQEVKAIVDTLRDSGRKEHTLHREVYRPWGKYDSIDFGARDQVKRITVNPGEKLSIQKHYHRSEHWIVVSGTASVLIGDKTIIVTENESTYIPLGTIHALENPGKIPLEMIEVQTGTYLGEDDIVRFEDRYGRD